MRLRELEIFNALMKTGTTIGAANQLLISQPAVSKALKHLEHRTGVKLFKRVSGRLRPTPEGQTLYRHVRNVFARLETIERISQDIRGGRSAVISVAATPTLGNSLLATAAVRFRKAHPDVQIIFRSITSHDVGRRVAEGEADFGLVHSPVDCAGLELEELMPFEIVCIAPRDHPLASQPIVRLSDLNAYRLISYRPGTATGSKIAAAFRAEGLEKKIDMQTSLSATACVLASEHAGVAVTDPFPLLMTDFPGLIVRPLRPRIGIDVQLLFSREHPSSSIAMRLVTEVRAVAADMAKRLADMTAAESTHDAKRVVSIRAAARPVRRGDKVA